MQRNEEQLLADAQAAQQAGAFAIVLECIPAAMADRITAAVSIPTIGIGAGAGCDGQILVLHDLLGLGTAALPRHAKAYADLGAVDLPGRRPLSRRGPPRHFSRQGTNVSIK